MKNLFTIMVSVFSYAFAFGQTPEEMKAWEKNMTPGEPHKWMQTLSGEWDTETKMWMDPAQPPMVSKGSCTNTMIMGGRYMEYKFKGDVMGMPFEGQGVMAYDNAAKKFYSTWHDSMSTGLMYMEGTFNEKTQTMTSMGNCVDPMTGKPMQVKEISKFHSKDKHTMEMYMVMDGKETKTMEITYTRKK